MASAKDFVRFCATVGLDLEPFQRKIARAAFGDQHELLVLLSRGNGKSRLIGALAVYHLLHEPRPAAYVAAASRDQARVVYEYAREFALHPSIAERFVVRHLELRVDGGFLRVLASDAPKLHGLTPSLSVVDELHAFRDASVYEAMRTAMLKRADSRMIVISTAAQGADSPLGRLRARALAQPRVRCSGSLTETAGSSIRMLEWAVPETADVDDPAVVKRANPASWLSVEALRDQREAVPDIAFRRYHCNQWTAGEGSWLPAGAWHACAGEPEFEVGERIWVGVDVGGERADSAVVWASERLHVGVAVYHGDEGVLDCVAKVRELAALYTVQECVFDPWRFTQAALEFEREGLVPVAFPQTDARMIPASQRLYDAVVEGRLVHPNDQQLNRHAANAVARHSRRGWRLDKPERSANIDALVALAMAIERAEARPEPVRLLGWL